MMLQGFCVEKLYKTKPSAFGVKKLGPTKMRFVGGSGDQLLGDRSNCKKSRRNGKISIWLEGEAFELRWKKCDFFSGIPGWSVASDGGCDWALDVDVDEELKARKESPGFAVKPDPGIFEKSWVWKIQDKIKIQFCLTIMIWSNAAVARIRNLQSLSRDQSGKLWALNLIGKMHLCWRWTILNISIKSRKGPKF